MGNNENEPKTTPPGNGDDGRRHSRSLSIDFERYERFLAQSDLTADQKREFIETLWSIIVGFVDLGFGIHPLQQLDENPGDRLADSTLIMTQAPSDEASSDHCPKKKFENAAGGSDIPPGERRHP